MCRKLSEVAPLSPRARAEENLRRGLLSVYTTLMEIANASGRGNALSDVHSLEEEKGSDAAFSEAVTWLRLRRGRYDKDGAGRCRSATPALPFGAFRRIFGNSFGKAGAGKISGVDWDSLFHSIRSRQVFADEPLAESVLRGTASSSLPLSLYNAGQDVASTADFTLPPWALDPLLSLLCAGLTHDLFSKRAARVALERIGLGGGITGFRKMFRVLVVYLERSDPDTLLAQLNRDLTSSPVFVWLRDELLALLSAHYEEPGTSYSQGVVVDGVDDSVFDQVGQNVPRTNTAARENCDGNFDDALSPKDAASSPRWKDLVKIVAEDEEGVSLRAVSVHPLGIDSTLRHRRPLLLYFPSHNDSNSATADIWPPLEVSSLVKESGLLRDKDSGTFVIDADALSSIDQNTEFILLMLLGNKMVAFHHARADLMERISKVTQYLSLAYYAAYGPYDPSDTTTMAGMRLDFVRDCLELSIIDYGSE
eukprot:gene1374-1564_t